MTDSTTNTPTLRERLFGEKRTTETQRRAAIIEQMVEMFERKPQKALSDFERIGDFPVMHDLYKKTALKSPNSAAIAIPALISYLTQHPEKITPESFPRELLMIIAGKYPQVMVNYYAVNTGATHSEAEKAELLRIAYVNLRADKLAVTLEDHYRDRPAMSRAGTVGPGSDTPTTPLSPIPEPSSKLSPYQQALLALEAAYPDLSSPSKDTRKQAQGAIMLLVEEYPALMPVVESMLDGKHPKPMIPAAPIPAAGSQKAPKAAETTPAITPTTSQPAVTPTTPATLVPAASIVRVAAPPPVYAPMAEAALHPDLQGVDQPAARDKPGQKGHVDPFLKRRAAVEALVAKGTGSGGPPRMTELLRLDGDTVKLPAQGR